MMVKAFALAMGLLLMAPIMGIYLPGGNDVAQASEYTFYVSDYNGSAKNPAYRTVDYVTLNPGECYYGYITMTYPSGTIHFVSSDPSKVSIQGLGWSGDVYSFKLTAHRYIADTELVGFANSVNSSDYCLIGVESN